MILTETQVAIRDVVRDWAQAQIQMRSASFQDARGYPDGLFQEMAGLGGYLEEFGLAKIYRDVRVCQIYEGTSDIQRTVIARAL